MLLGQNKPRSLSLEVSSSLLFWPGPHRILCFGSLMATLSTEGSSDSSRAERVEVPFIWNVEMMQLQPVESQWSPSNRAAIEGFSPPDTPAFEPIAPQSVTVAMLKLPSPLLHVTWPFFAILGLLPSSDECQFISSSRHEEHLHPLQPSIKAWSSKARGRYRDS